MPDNCKASFVGLSGIFFWDSQTLFIVIVKHIFWDLKIIVFEFEVHFEVKINIFEQTQYGPPIYQFSISSLLAPPLLVLATDIVLIPGQICCSQL